MGSLPDSKYIIKTDGYWFVEAHDVDPSKGYISVSAKGIVNGLSNIPNDGADFGPDSYNPNYSGSGIPYTQTSGIQEAFTYGENNSTIVHLLSGKFECTRTPTITDALTVIGSGNISFKSFNPFPSGSNPIIPATASVIVQNSANTNGLNIEVNYRSVNLDNFSVLLTQTGGHGIYCVPSSPTTDTGGFVESDGAGSFGLNRGSTAI